VLIFYGASVTPYLHVALTASMSSIHLLCLPPMFVVTGDFRNVDSCSRSRFLAGSKCGTVSGGKNSPTGVPTNASICFRVSPVLAETCREDERVGVVTALYRIGVGEVLAGVGEVRVLVIGSVA
jgi:hypothetical protein